MINSLVNVTVLEEEKEPAIAELESLFEIVQYFPVEVSLFGTCFIFDSRTEIGEFIERIKNGTSKET